MSENIPVFEESDINQNKTMAALACVPILFWLPLVSCPNSAFGKFYANQGLLLLIVGVILGICTPILTIIFGFIPILGGIITALISLLSLGVLVLMIMQIVAAIGGKAKLLPIFGHITILK